MNAISEYIYHLIDPRTHRIRYVGKSVNPYRRLIAHMTGCSSYPCGKWLGELKECGLEPVMRIVAICKDGAKLRERKEITRLVKSGESLENVVCRGEKRFIKSRHFQKDATAYHGRMPNEYYTRFKAQAAAESRSFSNLITKALIEWLDSQAGKKK